MTRVVVQNKAHCEVTEFTAKWPTAVLEQDHRAYG
jgi:hypothetical protein